MNFLDRIFRDQLEWANGRITIASGNWIFGTEIPNGMEFYHKHVIQGVDKSGRDMVLVKQKGVFCHNSEIGKDYPQSKDAKNYFVPFSVCQKCQYHERKSPRSRFYYCRYDREQRGGERKTVKQITEMVNDAVRTAKEIIGE